MNGKEKAMEIWKKAAGLFTTDKKIKWIVLIGFVGILLILISEFLPQSYANTARRRIRISR